MTMIKGPDFSKKDRDVLMVKLPDGAGGSVEIAVLPPTKNVLDKVKALAEAIDAVTTGDMEPQDFDIAMAVEVCAEAMSRNTRYTKIDADTLDDIGFDIEDVGEFIAAYITFIAALVEAKN